MKIKKKCKTCSKEFEVMLCRKNKAHFCSWKCYCAYYRGRKRKPFSEEHKRKISISSMGKVVSEETKRKISIAGKDRIISEKTKQKLSKGKMGKLNPFWGKTHSLEIRKKISVANKNRVGKLSSSWKGGISKLNHRIRNIEQYKQWRKKIFERDEYTCQCCKRSGYIEAHHKIPLFSMLQKNNIKTIKQAVQCKDLWDINNGITLCPKCHNETKKGRPEYYLVKVQKLEGL